MWGGLGPQHNLSLPSQSHRAGTTHLQDKDGDKGDREDDHHLGELTVSHTLLAREVILQQMGHINTSVPKDH